MSQPDSLTGSLNRLRREDETAAVEVVQRFAGLLIRLATTPLDPHVRRQVDSEAVGQAVFRSSFVRRAEGQFELER